MYPLSSKRGFPEGYLSGLEQRLIETEWALFETMAGLSSLDMPEFARDLFQNSAEKQSKTARAEEWHRLSIASPEDRYRWFHEKWRILDFTERTQLTEKAYTSVTPGYTELHGHPQTQQVSGFDLTGSNQTSITPVVAGVADWSQPSVDSGDSRVSSSLEPESTSQASRLSRQQSHRFF